MNEKEQANGTGDVKPMQPDSDPTFAAWWEQYGAALRGLSPRVIAYAGWSRDRWNPPPVASNGFVDAVRALLLRLPNSKQDPNVVKSHPAGQEILALEEMLGGPVAERSCPCSPGFCANTSGGMLPNCREENAVRKELT